MKKIYTTLCALAIGAMAVFAADPVYNETTSTGYADIKTAWEAAADGDVLALNEDIKVSSRLAIDNKSLTIKGNNHKILRDIKNSLLFLLNANGILTIENATFESNDIASSTAMIEAGKAGAMLYLSDVTFENCTSTNNQGLVCAKSSGKFSINNVTFNNCTVNEGVGELFVGQNDCEIAGDNKCVIFEEKRVKIVGELTNVEPIKIIVKTPAAGTIVALQAKGYADKFVSGNDGWHFELNAKNELVMAEGASSAIDDIATDASEAIVNVYNLQGMLIRANVAASEATEGLATGLYIVGGKKVYVQ